MAQDRYVKFKSSYILKKYHQTVDGGVIYESDWPTIGERQNFGPDKKIVYGDSGFLFTDNVYGLPSMKSSVGKWVGSYRYDDVKNAKDDINKVKLNLESVNPMSYAYYGSFMKLVEGTVIDTILYFPANLKYGTIPLNYRYQQYFDNLILSEVTNPFLIDFTSTSINEGDNPLRYMALSWKNYVIVDNGNEQEILSYSIKNVSESADILKTVLVGDGELVFFNGRYYKYDKGTLEYYEVGVEDSDNYFVKCGEYIRNKDAYYKWNSEIHSYEEIKVTQFCPPEIYRNYEITFRTESKSYSIYGYINNGVQSFFNELLCGDIEIRPKKEIIENYFDNLKGFQRFILNRSTNPKYSFSLNTFFIDKNGFYRNVLKKYTWPSDGYCLIIDGPQYTSFINEIMDMAEVCDNITSDNIWRNMTHESIKNFDWSYEQDRNESDETDNAIGSQRMCSLLRLVGLEFDELKQYIDGIKHSNRITYDCYLNMPDSELSEQCVISGFDVYSTIWRNNSFVEVNGDEIPSNAFVTNYFVLPDPDSETSDYISVGCEESQNGVVFYHKEKTISENVSITEEFINSDAISKENPWIRRNNAGYVYESLVFKPDVDEAYWTNRNTFDTAPTIGSRFSPKYVRVYNNGGFLYYEKKEFIDNSDFLHGRWYDAYNCESVSQTVSDIDFTRRLSLSAKEILRTKGTLESIDMVMGLFGFGRGNSILDSDYTLSESYYATEQRGYSDIFWFYERIDGPQEGVSYTPSNTFAYLPLYATDNESRFPRNIRVSNTFGGYDYFNKNGKYTNREAIVKIYNGMGGESFYDKQYGGIPVSEGYVNGKHCFVPYLSDKFSYKGNLYFHMKGGWCKQSEIGNGVYDFMETVPYVRSVESCSSLLEISETGIEVGDFVYTKSLYDYESVFGGSTEHTSNYFKLVVNDPSEVSSWRNIPITGPIEFDNYTPSDSNDYLAATHEDFLNAKFIDMVIFSNTGNNPHSGEGKYDIGDTYTQYMSLPFKYSIDNYEFSDGSILDMATQFAFNVTGNNFTENKIFTFFGKYRYFEVETPNIDEDYWDESNTFESIPDRVYPSTPDLIRVVDGYNFSYFKKEGVACDDNGYLLDSKVLIMRNLLNNNLYKRFFRNIIKNYLLQVIPSTCIFIFENFNECEQNIGVFYNVTVMSNNEQYGTVSGGGSYAECDFATIKAVAYDGYHFVGWKRVDCSNLIPYTENSFESEDKYTFKVIENICYLAEFEEDCIVKVTNGLTHCSDFSINDKTQYGRIFINNSNEVLVGDSVVLDAYDSLVFNAIPNHGYYQTTWSVLDSEMIDVTEKKIEEKCIDLSDKTMLVISDKKCLCGYTIVCVYEEEKYEVEADVRCDGCGDVEMSYSPDCNEVKLRFFCEDNDTNCCSNLIKKIDNEVIDGNEIYVERNSEHSFKFELTDGSECDDITYFYINGTRYNNGAIINITEDTDVYVYMNLTENSAVITFSCGSENLCGNSCCDTLLLLIDWNLINDMSAVVQKGQHTIYVDNEFTNCCILDSIYLNGKKINNGETVDITGDSLVEINLTCETNMVTFSTYDGKGGVSCPNYLGIDMSVSYDYGDNWEVVECPLKTMVNCADAPLIKLHSEMYTFSVETYMDNELIESVSNVYEYIYAYYHDDESSEHNIVFHIF